MYKEFDISNPLMALTGMEGIQDRLTSTTLTEDDYEGKYEGGIEAECERLTEEADMYKGISTVIALETINANRAIVAINNGENPVTAFKLYGFEADEGETDQQMVEQATSKEGILKRAWKALLGYVSNATAYIAHLVKIKRISGRVFNVIFSDVKKTLDKLATAKAQGAEKLTGKQIKVNKELAENWEKVANIYKKDHDKEFDKLPEDPTNDDLKEFVRKYAEMVGVELGEGGVLSEDAVNRKYDENDEILKLNGAKDTEDLDGASALERVENVLNVIQSYSEVRRNAEGAKSDVVREFEAAFKDVKKIVKKLDKQVKKDESLDDAQKADITNLTTSLKALSTLAKKQAKIYNLCLKDFTNLAKYAVNNGEAVIKVMK